ncbi:uncharacterized protein LOC121387530 [Gigantopelta aegis]|uniref:uncharacterized protein LOC121387530 n=1 Tax=Gigantopelta aegis TaxID=1735272 RepID=UPI001B887D33|nr:uncharacterized protein LOC121387530 [Gigantopelta aegis]
MDSVQYKRPTLWNPDSKSERQAEYLKRLTQLRASLIGQEESNLAHALERFRITTTMSTDSSLRPRESRLGVPRRRRFLSTYEQFKMMRPVKPPVFIFPLEGHQLFEPSSTPKVGNGGKGIGSKKQKHVDETVKINLQRMRNPTSSFPNSTRTVVKQNELVLDTTNIEGCTPTNSPNRFLSESSRAARSKSSNSEHLTVGSFDKDGEHDYVRPRSYGGVSFPSINIPRVNEQQSMFRTHLKVKTTHRLDSSSCREPHREHDRQMYVLPRIQQSGLKSTRHSNTNSTKKRNGDAKTKASKEETTRKCIRVDMPTIYNCPSSDMDESTDGSCDTGTLDNVYTQRSFQEELQSLIDDVREFNSRTDSLIQF